MHLVATTVVRLVGPLAHELLFRCGWQVWWVTSAVGAGASPTDETRAALPGCTTQPLTDQRYAVVGHRVKPAADRAESPDRVSMPWPGRGPGNAPVGLWRTACAGPPNGVRFGSHRGSLPPSGVASRSGDFPAATATAVTPVSRTPRSRGAQPVEKAVESLRGHHLDNFERTGSPQQRAATTQTQWEKATPSWSRPTRTSPTPGGPSSTTSSPTSGPGSRACDPVTVHDELAIIAVPDEFTRTQVEGRLRAELEGALSEVVRPRDPASAHDQPGPRRRLARARAAQAHADQQRPAGRRARRLARRPSRGARQRRRFID